MTLQALFFDVFGTVVDWRTGIVEALREAAGPAGTGTSGPRSWEAVADEWRRAYPPALLAARQQPGWRNLDELQAETLDEVLGRHDLTLPAEQRSALVLAWRRLPPWPDARTGLARLRRDYRTATLSNGHVALLVDLLRYGDLRFDAVLSAELASSYKPDAEVYRRAAALLECAPAQAGMVAAHADDLEAAAAVGLRPIFVRRPLEWGPDATPAEPPDLPGLVVADDLAALADLPALESRP